MLPSLPILAGQGFIIRAAQKSTASRVAKDRKAFVLTISTAARSQMDPLQCSPPLHHQGRQSHLLATRFRFHTRPHPALQASFVSRPGWLCLTANSWIGENRSSRVFLNYSEELWWENMTRQFPSRTQFFGLLSLTFVTFPHFSAFHGFLSL